jgi:hypothetical protein
LRAVCKSVSVSNLIETAATEAERKAGFDLSDYLVRFSASDFSEPKEYEQTQTEQATKEWQPEQSKQYPAYVSDTGTLYIPTPPDGQSQYTVYTSVEAYNRRSETPRIVWQKDTPLNLAKMKQIFINLNTLKI